MPRKQVQVRNVNVSIENPLFAALDTLQVWDETKYVPNSVLKKDGSQFDDLSLVYNTLAEATGVEAIPFEEKGSETFSFSFKGGKLKRMYSPSIQRMANPNGEGFIAVVRWGRQIFPLTKSLGNHDKIVQLNAGGELYRFMECHIGTYQKEKALLLKFAVSPDEHIQMAFRVQLQWTKGEDGVDVAPQISPDMLYNEFYAEEVDEDDNIIESDFISSYFTDLLSTFDPNRGGNTIKLTALPTDEGRKFNLIHAKPVKAAYGPSNILTIESEGETFRTFSNGKINEKLTAGMVVSKEEPCVFTFKLGKTREGKPSALITFETTPFPNRSLVTLNDLI